MNLTEDLYRCRQSTPDKTALAIDEHRLSYRGLVDLAEGYSARLAGLGVAPGDRVCFFMGNRLELAGLYLACFRLGAVAVPVSCFYKPAEVRYAAGHCQARLLVTEPELYAGVAGLADEVDSLRGVYLAGGGGDGPRFEAAGAGAAPAPPAELEPSAPAVILYTSGSTGRPKGVTHTVGSLGQNTRNRCAALGHDSQDVYFISSYFCHGSALTSVFLPMLAKGGTMVLMRHFTPEGFLEVLRRERPTVVGAAPSQIKAVLEEPSLSRDDFSSIRYLHVGGDAAPLELFGRFAEKIGRPLGVAMGMTECGGYLLTPPQGPYKPGSMGRPIPGTEVRLIDGDGREVPAGEIGQVVVRTGALMDRYWDDPENTAKVIKDGWLLTGDLARRDQDGFYFFVGRSKHIIVRDCGNVAPVEVEDVLDAHPKVRASGATGVPDGDHGQAVMALVVPASPDDPPTVEELEEFTRERLSDRKVPRRWRFVDHIPLTPMDKIDRKALAQLAAEE